jgi:hypothetical protein
VLWAIRNGDREISVTVHRMDERFDTGPILTQRGGIPLDGDVTPQLLWPRIRPVLRDAANAWTIALVKAVDMHDPSCGDFVPYLRKWIFGEVRREARREWQSALPPPCMAT